MTSENSILWAIEGERRYLKYLKPKNQIKIMATVFIRQLNDAGVYLIYKCSETVFAPENKL